MPSLRRRYNWKRKRTQGDNLVGVDGLEELLLAAEELVEELNELGDATVAAREDDGIDLGGVLEKIA